MMNENSQCILDAVPEKLRDRRRFRPVRDAVSTWQCRSDRRKPWERQMSVKDRIIGAGFEAFRLTRLHKLARSATRGLGAILMLHHVRPWRPATPGFAPN